MHLPVNDLRRNVLKIEIFSRAYVLRFQYRSKKNYLSIYIQSLFTTVSDNHSYGTTERANFDQNHINTSNGKTIFVPEILLEPPTPTPP